MKKQVDEVKKDIRKRMKDKKSFIAWCQSKGIQPIQLVRWVDGKQDIRLCTLLKIIE